MFEEHLLLTGMLVKFNFILVTVVSVELFRPLKPDLQRTVCAKAKANCIQESTEEVKALKVPERDEDRSHPWYVFLLLKLSALLETSYSLSEGNE